jgi:predicted amidohydrolase
MRFDLLIKGGEVVDPGGGREGRLDVAINGERIAAVDSAIPADAAYRVIDGSVRGTRASSWTLATAPGRSHTRPPRR